MIESLANLALSLIVFGIGHAVPANTRARYAIATRVGERGYLGLYSTLSLGLLVWVILAYRAAPYVELWWMPPWWRVAAMVAMAPAVFLLVLGFRKPSPDRLGIHAVTRQPLMAALAVWSTVHIIGNGDVASVMLFVGLGVLAVPGAIHAENRLAAAMGEPAWSILQARTSILPFAALANGRARRHVGPIDPLATVLAAMVYLGLLVLHGPVIGIDLLNS